MFLIFKIKVPRHLNMNMFWYRQANFLCDFHPSTCKGNAGLGSFCILETSFSFLKTSFGILKLSFSNFQRIITNFFTKIFIFPMSFKQFTRKTDWKWLLSIQKQVLVQQICIKMLENKFFEGQNRVLQ